MKRKGQSESPKIREIDQPGIVNSSGYFWACNPPSTPSGMQDVFSFEIKTPDFGEIFSSLAAGGHLAPEDFSPLLNHSKILIDLAAVSPDALDLKTLKKDITLISDIVAAHGKEVLEILRHLNDSEKVTELANKIGLTEEYFSARGGGFWVLLVLLGAVVLSGCAVAETHERPTINVLCDAVIGPRSGKAKGRGAGNTPEKAWFRARKTAMDNAEQKAFHAFDDLRCPDPNCPLLSRDKVQITEPPGVQQTKFTQKNVKDFWGNVESEQVCELEVTWTATARCVPRGS